MSIYEMNGRQLREYRKTIYARLADCYACLSKGSSNAGKCRQLINEASYELAHVDMQLDYLDEIERMDRTYALMNA